MSSPTTSQGVFVSHHLRIIKGILQDAAFGTKITTIPDQTEFDVLERGVFEVHQLIQSWRNSIAPINRIPPEILTFVPDFWHGGSRDQDLIALTHVCRTWRELFVSRPLLWTHIDCVGLDKTHVYLERSKSSPINLSLNGDCLSPSGPFLELIPRIIGRLKSLRIDATMGGLQIVTAHLSHPAPLLEELSVTGRHNPVLASTFFNGDISSLRKLHLEGIYTELPWRNMVNLTSFKLVHASPIAVGQFLDFFESAPHLRDVRLSSIARITGAQTGRLVSLACLERMYARGHHPSSLLFDHLLIPAGAHVRIQVNLPIPPAEGHPPRFLDNLRNLPNFTAIKLEDKPSRMLFNGPNGEVKVVPQVDGTCLMLEFLTHFDTSKTEQLEIKCGKCPFSDPIHRVLFPMKDLRTLALTRCEDPRIFVRALQHGIGSSGVVVCPKLEMLVIVHDGTFDIKDVVEMAAARALGGAKLKTVRIFPLPKTVNLRHDVLELKRHVLHVESWRDPRQRSRWNEEDRGGDGDVL